MIGIIDYGSGNVNAIGAIYQNLNLPFKFISNVNDFVGIEKIILPGVGAFDATMQQLSNSGLLEKINYLVLDKKMPILGICVGMQVMASKSEEGNLKGFGWISGTVKKFNKALIEFKPKIPHMGWNSIKNANIHPIFNGIDFNIGFYFIHSFYFKCDDESNILSTTNYYNIFTSSIIKNNIFGVQFHPEKSHSNGVIFLENFAKI